MFDGPGTAVRIRLLVLGIILASAGLAVPSAFPQAAAASQTHAPIFIDGNAAFTAANGVVGGTGTPSDPYRIDGWVIAAGNGTGLQIRDASASVLVSNVTVLSGFGGFYFFNVTSVTAVNVTAEAAQQFGIQVDGSSGVVVRNSTAEFNTNGIVVSNSAGARLTGNLVFANSENGIFVVGSRDATVQANTVAHNALAAGYGVSLEDSTNVTLAGNAFTYNGIHLYGSTVAAYDSHTIGADNLVNGAPIVYEKSCSGVRLSGLVLGELILANCRDTVAADLALAYSDVAVEVAYGTNVTLGPGIAVTNASTAIEVDVSSRVSVVGADLVDTGYGVLASAVRGLQVSGSRITSPFWPGQIAEGISVASSAIVNISGVVVRHHRAGVFLYASSTISVWDATLMENAGYGLDVLASSNVSVSGSLLDVNGGGLRLSQTANGTVFGNEVRANVGPGAALVSSSRILLAHNDFRSNAPNAEDDLGPQNAWNQSYPAGGNHWSDYYGVDHCHGASQTICNGGDGIGDTPYPIDANSTDEYPLMASPVAIDAPPEAYFSLAPAVGTVLTTFRVNASGSSDLEDAAAALQVRWDWNGDGLWDTNWSTSKQASHRYTATGTYMVQVEVRDTANLTDSWAQTVLVVPKPDNLPPTVTVRAAGQASVGQPVVVTADVADPSGVRNVTLAYQGVRGGAFVAEPMSPAGGTNWSASIPGQPGPGTVSYVVFANDTWANEARAPLAGTDSISVVDTLTPLLATVGVIGAAVAVAAYVLLRGRRGKASPAAEGSPPPGTTSGDSDARNPAPPRQGR